MDKLSSKNMADGVGFEPTVRCRTSVFKTGALNRSATHPLVAAQYQTYYAALKVVAKTNEQYK
jgi:hypothetical protein